MFLFFIDVDKKNDMNINIYLGSKSTIKIDAVKQVFPQANIFTEDVSSKVSSQPVGVTETLSGAFNRAYGMLPIAKRDIGNDTSSFLYFACGIENGMMYDDNDGTWSDVACVVFIDVHCPKIQMVSWSPKLEIPATYIQQCSDSSTNKIIKNWSTEKDPHSTLTHGLFPRKWFLCQALHNISDKIGVFL